ncbi:uncharacterized protein LOC144872559 isoform X2 [Branchiostoma floridae x Branchiostoma japonicum]
MAEVGSLQVDHSYKRVVESWFPDLFRNQQSKSKASNAGETKSNVGKNRSESESTSLVDKSTLKPQMKKKETVPMATKIGSLVEGKILPKLKKRQHQQQNQQGGNPGNRMATADPHESEDQDSKLKSLSQQKQQVSPQQQQGGQKMSRSQVRRMKRRQKKAQLEQQAAGTQEVPEPVTGQFPTLENLLQSPSKLSQGKVDGSEQNKDKDKKNNGPKQSPSHTGLNVKVETPSQKQKAGNKEKESISPTNSWGMKDSTGKKASTSSTQVGQMEPQTPGKTVNGGDMSSPISKKKKIKKQQQSQEQSVTESPKSSKQTPEKQLDSDLKLSSPNAEAKSNQATTPSPVSKNKRKIVQATPEHPLSDLPVSPKQDSAASNKTTDALLKGDLKQVEVTQDESCTISKKRRRRRRSKSKEPPSKDLAESKEDTADSKNPMNVIQVNLFISPTGNGEQVGNLEGEVSTPVDGKKKRKQRKTKKVVTPEEQKPHEPVEPSPKKPKLQNQPDLPGGAAKQAIEKQMSTSSVSPASPTGQETSPTKKAKKKRKNSLVSEQGSGKKTVEEDIVSITEGITEGIPAKKQRLSVEKNDTNEQPAGAPKRRKRARGKRKRTTSEQSQSSETGASTAVEPGSEEGGTVSSAKPESDSATTLSPTCKKRKRRRRNRHKKDVLPGEE